MPVLGVLVLLGRIALAACLGLAGITKLADRPGTRRALAEFGVPPPLTGVLAIGLPIAELAVAIALIPNTTALPAALAALTLFGVFSAAISVNLVRGRRPNCNCFGQLHLTPIGWPTLMRNAALSLAAALAVWQSWSEPSATSAWTLPEPATWITALAGAVVLGLLALEGWLILKLIAQQGRLLLRLEELEARLGTGQAPSAPAVGRRAGCRSALRRPTFGSMACGVKRSPSPRF